MAIVIYECDTCKRQRTVVRRPESLDVIQRCTITDGCRGSLFQIRDGLKQDYTRGTTPVRVSGLNDWSQSPKIYSFVVSNRTPQQVWSIVHPLGGTPIVNVYIDRPLPNDPTYRELTDDYTVSYDPSTSTVTVTFDSTKSGLAVLQVRETQPNTTITETVIVPDTLLTLNDPVDNDAPGMITIATKSDDPFVLLNVTFTTIHNTLIEYNYSIPDVSNNQLWPSGKLNILGKIYTVRTFNILQLPLVDISAGEVSLGSSIKFSNLTGSKEVFILLNKTPYESTPADNVFDKIIDTNYNPIPVTLYLKSLTQVYAKPNVVRPVYPHIKYIT